MGFLFRIEINKDKINNNAFKVEKYQCDNNLIVYK